GFSLQHNFIETSDTRCQDGCTASIGFQDDHREPLVTFRRNDLHDCATDYLQNLLARAKSEKLDRQTAAPGLSLELVSQRPVSHDLEGESIDVSPGLQQCAESLL